jgi:hypothetical protein
MDIFGKRERKRVSSENSSTVGRCVGLDKTDREIGLIVCVFLENSIERKGFLEVYMTAEDTQVGWLGSNTCFVGGRKCRNKYIHSL